RAHRARRDLRDPRERRWSRAVDEGKSCLHNEWIHSNMQCILCLPARFSRIGANSAKRVRMSGPQPKKAQPALAPLDGTDLAILAALMEDGRMTNAALAARVGVAESTCAYRVRALRRSGVIESITARLNLGALGAPIQA